MVTKTISIKDHHQDWIDERSVNLSRFVQKRIDEDLSRFVQKKIDEDLGDRDELREE